MKFFIDTANVEEIRDAIQLGVLDGVTTNPTLVAKTGRSFKEVIMEICSIVDGPVSAEVVSLEAEGMIREGRLLSGWAPNIVVKIPILPEGLKAIKILSQENIQINTTLVFNPLQALMAAKAGATYISPFLGRLDDVSSDGMSLVRDIKIILDNYGFKAQIIASSIRHPMHVVEAAKIGAHVATIPYSVIKNLIKHPLTDIGIKNFLADWEKVPEKPF
ncbi:MAG: fructose-6-phosphate aldolase [Candidatus Atribacteria bacterium]|nr:fructose-6-phosphate aldolase [Candidatus Atribacteria bacterium]